MVNEAQVEVEGVGAFEAAERWAAANMASLTNAFPTVVTLPIGH